MLLRSDPAFAQHTTRGASTPLAGGTDRDLLPDPDAAVVALLDEQTGQRPFPLREFDQIHMRTVDAARHLQALSAYTEGKHVVFMGDSDGVALGLVTAARRSLLPSPAGVTLCDFDDRVLESTRLSARRYGTSALLDVRRYNVFSPLPADLQERFDFFHTNPPYGMYNQGRSVVAFLERCLAASKHASAGVVVLGNDARREWTLRVLCVVLQYLISRGVTPSRVLQRVHRYSLDDDPDLESGLIYCQSVLPAPVVGPDSPLPRSYVKYFYGRHTTAVPEFIARSGEPVYRREEGDVLPLVLAGPA